MGGSEPHGDSSTEKLRHEWGSRGWGRPCRFVPPPLPPTRRLGTRWASRRKEAAGWGGADPGGIPGGNGLDWEWGGGGGPVPGGPPRPPAAAPGAAPRHGDSTGHCERPWGKGYPGGPGGSVASGWGSILSWGVWGGDICLEISGGAVCLGELESPPFLYPLAPLAVEASRARCVFHPAGRLGVGVLGRREPLQHPQQYPALSPHPPCTSCTFWGDGGCIPVCGWENTWCLLLRLRAHPNLGRGRLEGGSSPLATVCSPGWIPDLCADGFGCENRSLGHPGDTATWGAWGASGLRVQHRSKNPEI